MADDAVLIEVQDPTTPASRLQAIAAGRPDLHPQIAAHPQAYPELVAWIAAQPPAIARPVAPVASSQVLSQTPSPYPAPQSPAYPAQSSYPAPIGYGARPAASSGSLGGAIALLVIGGIMVLVAAIFLYGVGFYLSDLLFVVPLGVIGLVLLVVGSKLYRRANVARVQARTSQGRH